MAWEKQPITYHDWLLDREEYLDEWIEEGTRGRNEHSNNCLLSWCSFENEKILYSSQRKLIGWQKGIKWKHNGQMAGLKQTRNKSSIFGNR